MLSNEKMVKVVVDNINKERVNKVNQTKKELEKIDKELEKLDNKKKKIFEAYEDEIITKEEFLDRREELNDRIKILGKEKIPLVTTLSDDVNEKILYEFIRNILKNFSKVLSSNITREQQKTLLHMVISEISVNELREIHSIKLKINDKLVDYLKKEEGVSVKGTPSSFILRNVEINALNLDIAI